ncbi:PRC-barrel domain containing protein [Kitasatospora sp. NPDC056446]|uniref:PRC-barrel domain containing protein n=1 Tax=Kitasatospora sp. NPDC056446 TaxID=3345819 RepID=UPI0036B490DB
MSTDLWEHRPGSHPAADLGLTGYEVSATDGPVGRVTQDTGDHLLVDADSWVPGTRVLVPVGLVVRVDHLDRAVHLDCPRARLSSAPPTAVDLTAPHPR